jgi:hypothetical protein
MEKVQQNYFRHYNAPLSETFKLLVMVNETMDCGVYFITQMYTTWITKVYI